MLRGIRVLLALVLTLVVLVAASAWQATTSPSLDPIPTAQAGPKWYRGNLHTHSLWSDGDDFPEMIADWYKRNGYQFLALTDHNVLSDGERWLTLTDKNKREVALKKYRDRFGTAWVEERTEKGQKQVRLKPLSEFRSLLDEPGKFLLLPGEEITHSYAKRPVHMNAINLKDVIKPVDGTSVTETIRVNHRQVAEQARKVKRPILTSLNHPNWNWGVTGEDMIPADELRFFEVYNGHPGVRNDGDENHPSCDQLWDILLALRLGKYGLGAVGGLATDDSHGYHAYGVGKVNPGRGWVMVRAPYLSGEAIVRAMEAGDFYASTGVVLEDVKTTGGELALTIRGAPGVLYRTEFLATMKDANLDSTPRKFEGKDGKPLPVTRIYSKDVGKVVAESTELAPRYKLTGKEWYVRARVTSSKPHPNPFKKGDVEMAWTQPLVGK